VLAAKGYFTNHQLMWLQALLIMVAGLSLMTAGKIADSKTPKRIMQYGCMLLVVLAYPLLRIIDTQIGPALITAQIILIIINEI
jgi:sugar phosphate permease